MWRKLSVLWVLFLVVLTACALSPESQLQICVLSSCAEAEGENIEQVETNDPGTT